MGDIMEVPLHEEAPRVSAPGHDRKVSSDMASVPTDSPKSTPPNRQLAKYIVPDPLERFTDEAHEGVAADLAAYHAARAQGFFLATIEETGSIREFVSPMLYEANLAGIYFDLATTDEPDGDHIAYENAAAMRNREGIGPFIYAILEWANIDPNSIKAYSLEAAK